MSDMFRPDYHNHAHVFQFLELGIHIWLDMVNGGQDACCCWKDGQ